MKSGRLLITKIITLALFTACVPESETVFNKLVRSESGPGLQVSLDEDTSIRVSYKIPSLKDSIDPEYTITTKPLHGELIGCGQDKDMLDCTYIPDIDFYGMDYIQLRARDGGIIASDIAQISIEVKPVNDAPTISGTQQINTPYNVNQVLQALKGQDKEGDSLTYIISKSPNKGTLHNCFLLDSPFCTYNPDDRFSGSDSFSYKVKDENGAESDEEVVVNIEIGSIPPPTANEVLSGPGLKLSLKEDQTLKFSYTIPTSIKSKDPKFDILKSVTKGTLTACDNSDPKTLNCTYVPNLNFNGQDNLELRAKDGTTLAQNTAIIEFTISAVNDAPVLSGSQSLIIEHNRAQVFAALNATDVEQESLQYIITEEPKNGSLIACFVGQSKECTYKPKEDYEGTDSLKYKVKDASGLVSNGEVIVSLFIKEAELLPSDVTSGPGLKLSVDEDMSLPFSYTIPTSKKSKSPKYSIIKDFTNGTLKDCDMNDATKISCTYVPGKDFNGIDTLELRAEDGQIIAADKATIEITVKSVNDAPTISGSQSLDVEHNKSKIFEALPATDIDQDQIGYLITQAPTNGSVSSCFEGLSKTCTYTPNQDYEGSDLLKYKAKDSKGLVSSDEVIVAITVKKAPVIEDVIKTCAEALESGEGLTVHQETIRFPEAIECKFNDQYSESYLRNSGWSLAKKLSYVNAEKNGGRIDGTITARKEQNYNVQLPSKGKICDIQFNFPVQDMKYDDEIILTLNNYVLMSSQNYGENSPSSSYKNVGFAINALGLQKYNWSDGSNFLYGKKYASGSDAPKYCLGLDASSADYDQKCNIPKTDTLGQIKLDIPSAEIVKVGFASNELAELQDINFGFISTGDNDNGDCEHSAFNFDITVKYLEPAK